MSTYYAIGLLHLFIFLDLWAYVRACAKPTVSWDEWAANRWRTWPGGGFHMLWKYRHR